MLSYTPAQCHHLPAMTTRSGTERGWLPAWQLGGSVLQALLRHLCSRGPGMVALVARAVAVPFLVLSQVSHHVGGT